VSRFGISSQHSGERECGCDPNDYPAHVNLPICRAEAISVLKVILVDLGVFALAAFGVGLSLYRFNKNRRRGQCEAMSALEVTLLDSL